jgi:asparagine synthetase B (glutamine-hydrolysing)
VPLGQALRGQRDAPLEVHVVGRPYLGGAPATPQRLGETLAEQGAEALAALDGAFGVVIVDHQRQETHVVTDRFNVVPMYAGEGADGPVIGSHPDALAEYLGQETDFDAVTLAQALHMWYATFPYTYYRGIQELAPASVHTWDREGRHTTRPYWEPQFRGDEAPGHDALAEELASAIRAGVRRRVAAAETPGLLLSAGADSRGLLFTAVEERPISTYTFFDVPNSEMRLAARLAESVRQRHVPLQRDPEHYGAHAREATRLMAGMWNFLDGHAIGFLPRFEADGLDLLLSGDFADLLFKGNSLNVRYKKLFGKNLTLKTLAPFSASWRTPRARVSEALREPIAERVREQYAGIDTASLNEEGWWRVAHRRVGVLSRTSAVGGPTSLQRALPWDTFMADRAMASVYEQLTTEARVNGTVWERAVKRLTPKAARDIPNNNWGARVAASDAEKTARFLYGVAYRKLFRRDTDGTLLGAGVTRGSWPEFGHYLSHSPVVADLWHPRDPVAADALRDITGYDPWAPDAQPDPRRGGVAFGRLLTLKLWLEDRFAATPPI